jgi:hypothetical protein
MKNDLSRGNEVYSDDVFQVLIEYEISRSVRYPAPLAMLYLEMTPSAGLEEGTLREAPKIFTTALNTHLRSVDIPSGAGREYKILLPTANDAGVRSVCERLISVFRNKFNTPSGNSIAFSLNIGAASHAGGTSLTREGLMEKAESALKQAKLKGPNTYVMLS